MVTLWELVQMVIFIQFFFDKNCKDQSTLDILFISVKTQIDSDTIKNPYFFFSGSTQQKAVDRERSDEDCLLYLLQKQGYFNAIELMSTMEKYS